MILLKTSLLFFLLSCSLETGERLTENSENNLSNQSFDLIILNDTNRVEVGQTLTNDDENITFTFNRVILDSRCPTGVDCIWEGNAELEFRFTNADSVEVANLNTSSRFNTSIEIFNYRIELIKLNPTPIYNQAPPTDYSGHFRIVKL